MNLKRITRLLKLLRALQAGHGENAERMARSCGVSRRTIFRDLETLRAAGVPLGFDKGDSRYYIDSDYFEAPARLTLSEAASLIALANQLGGDDRLPLFRAARSATMKLQRGFSPALRTQIRRVARSIHLRQNAIDGLEGQEAAYQCLVEAIATRRVARMTYNSLTEWERIATKLRPYQLVFNRHSWYVIGRSSLHGEPRTFNLRRIVLIELTNERFAMPRGFNVDRYLGNAWNLMPQHGADNHVVVRFSSMVAQNVAEVTWHKTQRLEFHADGTLDFHVRVAGINEISWWILGYGDQAQVLRPSKLRRLIGFRVANMRRMYDA